MIEYKPECLPIVCNFHTVVIFYFQDQKQIYKDFETSTLTFIKYLLKPYKTFPLKKNQKLISKGFLIATRMFIKYLFPSRFNTQVLLSAETQYSLREYHYYYYFFALGQFISNSYFVWFDIKIMFFFYSLCYLLYTTTRNVY